MQFLAGLDILNRFVYKQKNVNFIEHWNSSNVLIEFFTLLALLPAKFYQVVSRGVSLSSLLIQNYKDISMTT